jgi:hypothetical protein
VPGPRARRGIGLIVVTFFMVRRKSVRDGPRVAIIDDDASMRKSLAAKTLQAWEMRRHAPCARLKERILKFLKSE